MKPVLLTISVAATLIAGVAQTQAAGTGGPLIGGPPPPWVVKCVEVNRATVCPARAVNAPGHAVKLINGKIGGAGTHAVSGAHDPPEPEDGVRVESTSRRVVHWVSTRLLLTGALAVVALAIGVGIGLSVSSG